MPGTITAITRTAAATTATRTESAAAMAGTLDADARCAPPDSIVSETHARISSGGLQWAIWEVQLPSGPEREPAILRLLLRLYAPAGALGYRLGRRHGPRQLMRWFPIKRAGPWPLYLLEPFQIPTVPVAGTYVVTYLDRELNPIGGPRFRIEIQTVATWLPLTMGDRSYRLKKGRGA